MNKKKLVSIVLYVIPILLTHLPLYKVDGQAFAFYKASEYIRGNVHFLDLYGASCIASVKAQTICMLVFEIITVLYLITVLLGKRGFLKYPALAFICGYMVMSTVGTYNIYDNTLGVVIPMLQLVSCSFEWIILRMMDVWAETVVLVEETARKEKHHKEEVERRLHFAGNYTRYFYQVIWKNFKYDWKDFGLFLGSSVIVAVLTYAGIGSYYTMAGMHRQELLLIGDGLAKIVLNAMIPMGICSIFLMVFILIFYMQKWMESTSIFVTLGIRRKALYIVLALEIVFAFITSILAGWILGGGLLWCVRRGIASMLQKEENFALGTVPFYMGFMMIAVMIVIYIISLGFTRDIVVDFDIRTAMTRRIRRQNLPHDWNKAAIIVGAVICTITLVLFTSITRHESAYLLALFFVGLFLIVRFGMASILNVLKKKSSYYPTLMDRNHLYHKSNTNAWYVFALIVLTVSGMFYFGNQLVSINIAQEPSDVFPYDYVCVVDDGDDEFFQELQEDYNIELASCPMVRVANTDRTEKLEGYYDVFVQGQQIGISESTYHDLKKLLDEEYEPTDLDLDAEGESVYLVHQQDLSLKAQPVDWTYGIKSPMLHIGYPCLGYNPMLARNTTTTYIRYKIAGEEFGSLFGCFRQGKQENVIVFSDEYFALAQEMWKNTNIVTGDIMEDESECILDVTIKQGPTKLVLIHADENDLDAIDARMAELEQNHIYEAKIDAEIRCWYSKRIAVSDMATERAMRLLVNLFVMIMLMATEMFLIYIKVVSEMVEKTERAKFLTCMGMKRKDRIKLLKKENYFLLVVPQTVSAVILVLFLMATFVARMYTAEVIMRFSVKYLVLWLVWVIVQVIYFWLINVWYIWKVEGRNE